MEVRIHREKDTTGTLEGTPHPKSSPVLVYGVLEPLSAKPGVEQKRKIKAPRGQVPWPRVI